MRKGNTTAKEEGWKRTALGDVYRLPITRALNWMGAPRLALKNTVLSIWYPSVASDEVDEKKTTKLISSSINKILGVKRNITVVENDNKDKIKGRQRFHVEYYTNLDHRPTREQIDEIVRVCDSPVLL